MKDVQVISYGRIYYDLTLDFYKKAPRLYENIKIDIMLKELQERGMYLQKCNKPTKKGTNMRFKAITKKEEFDKKMNAIVEYTKDINKQLGTSFRIEFASESDPQK